MITLQDCEDMCDVSKDEIIAFADHEHVPEIIAAEMAEQLVHTPEGIQKIRRMMEQDIDDALEQGYMEKASKLQLVLAKFNAKHPVFN